MPVMDIRIVRMAVRQRRVAMNMRVRFGAVPRKVMDVAMVIVVQMGMIVCHGSCTCRCS